MSGWQEGAGLAARTLLGAARESLPKAAGADAPLRRFAVRMVDPYIGSRVQWEGEDRADFLGVALAGRAFVRCIELPVASRPCCFNPFAPWPALCACLPRAD